MDYVFYGITMKTKKGQTLYLKCSDRETKNPYKTLFDWTFNIDEACLWEDDTVVEEFARGYFKNFKNYNIEQINVSQNMKCYRGGVLA